MLDQYLKDNINTCDLILCSGNSEFSKAIIAYNYVQKMKEFIIDPDVNKLKILNMLRDDISLRMSHVALVIKITDEEYVNWPVEISKHFRCCGGVYVFESTSIGYTGIKGVQINSIDEWRENYNGDCWFRCLQADTRIHNTEIAETMTGLIGTPYEAGIPGAFELMTSFNDGIESNTKNNVFCGEVDGIVLKKHGYLVDEFDPHKSPPMHFAPGGKIDDYATCVIGELIEF